MKPLIESLGSKESKMFEDHARKTIGQQVTHAPKNWLKKVHEKIKVWIRLKV